MKRNIIIIVGLFFSLISCKTDVDLQPDYDWQVIYKGFFSWDLAVTSEQKLFVLDHYNSIRYSFNEGNIWNSSFVSVTDEILYSFDIDESRESNFAVGDDGVVYISHGEVTNYTYWYNIYLDKSINNIGIYSFESNIWIVGLNDSMSKVYHYDETWGTHKWNHTEIPYSGMIKVYFLNEQIGWVFGHDRLFFSENSGETWTIQIEDETKFFSSICFVNETNGWLSTTEGIIYFTRNFGELWEEVYNNPEYAIRSIEFVNEEKGWAVGVKKNVQYDDLNGFIIYTMDGGKTWQESQFPVKALYDVDFIDENTGYAMGEDYLIMTVNGGH
ncbi:WD40/YVTN/BNR-like repeat-containing protein [Bacteroidota bacterium]